MIGSLASYPSKTVTIQFMIEIIPCIATQLTLDDLSPTYDRTYKLLDPTYTWNIVGSYVLTQVPACGYDYTLSSPTSSVV